MARNVDNIIKKLTPAQRKKVEDRTAALIAEELSRREKRETNKSKRKPALTKRTVKHKS